MSKTYSCLCVICGNWFDAKQHHATACPGFCRKEKSRILAAQRRGAEPRPCKTVVKNLDHTIAGLEAWNQRRRTRLAQNQRRMEVTR